MRSQFPLIVVHTGADAGVLLKNLDETDHHWAVFVPVMELLVVGVNLCHPWLRSRFVTDLDADRPNYPIRYLCFHGNGPPLPVAPGYTWR